MYCSGYICSSAVGGKAYCLGYQGDKRQGDRKIFRKKNPYITLVFPQKSKSVFGRFSKINAKAKQSYIGDFISGKKGGTENARGVAYKKFRKTIPYITFLVLKNSHPLFLQNEGASVSFYTRTRTNYIGSQRGQYRQPFSEGDARSFATSRDLLWRVIAGGGGFERGSLG